MATDSEEITLTRGWDYIQQIANTLQDLEGAGSLAHELIQNADDAGATRLAFRFTDVALEVEDDAGFKVCDDWRAAECGFEVDGHRPCDLHAFNRLGGGTKAADPDSTGAFGVGFLAVYQVTDRPEVLTSSLHFRIDEEERTTRVCSGDCDRAHVRKGTIIVLPWANRQSALRRKLKSEPVTANRRRQLIREFIEAIPTSMVFLRHIREVAVNSKHGSETLRRTLRGSRLTITGERKSERWTLMEAAFEEEAARLRDQHPQIETRHARVRVALPAEDRIDGRLFATLPTQVMTGLPVHIDASFYPRQDRKGIRLDGGFRTDWNRAAIDAAAHLLADDIEEISRQLGPRRFWALVRGAYRLSSEASPETQSLAPIWDALRGALPEGQVMWTNSDEWEVVEDTALAPSTKERARLLEALQIPTVSTKIKSLVPWQALRMRSVTLEQLIDGVERAQQEHSGDGFPEPWRSRGQREALQKLIAELAPKPGTDRDEQFDLRIRDLAIWESVDGRPASFNSAYLAPRNTVMAFHPVARHPFVQWGSRRHPSLAPIGDHYTLEVAVGDLEDADLDELDDSELKRIVHWLDKRAAELKDDDKKDDVERLRALPLFSTPAGRASAERSIRQGGFRDKLGLAGVLREADLVGAKAIATALGIRKLNFSDYLSRHVARAVESGDLDAKQCLEMLRLCANHVDAIDREPKLRELLAELECVPCTDGELHTPSKAYFNYKPVRDVLGTDAPIAVETIKPKSGVGDLLRRLGAVGEPRPGDVVDRVELVTEKPSTRARRKVISAVVDYLNKRPKKAGSEEGFSTLRDSNWLPASGDEAEWHAPDSLLLAKDRKLCASSGRFLGLPRQQQERCRAALVALGINPEPHVDLVVDHVANLSREDKAPTATVLKWLNGRSADEEINRLRSIAFLPGADGGLYRPSEIFRNRHQLEPWRPVLALKGVRPRQLLDALGVKDRPRADDAVGVLADIAGAVGAGSEPEKKARLVIRQAWRLISDADRVDAAPLRDLPVVLAGNRLRKPSDVLINDRPRVASGLSANAQATLIPRDVYTFRGLQRAGVSLLSERLTAKVVRRRDGVRQPHIERHIVERQEPLARAVRDGGGELGALFTFLSEIEVMSISPLALRYAIEGHPNATDAHQVRVPSHLDGSSLFVDAPDGNADWSRIANSLRDGLLPEAGAGGALAIKVVLSAADAIEADAELNEAGCAPLTREQLDELRTAIEHWEATKGEEEVEVTEDESGPATEDEDEEELEDSDEQEPGDGDEEEPGDGDEEEGPETGDPGRDGEEDTEGQDGDEGGKSTPGGGKGGGKKGGGSDRRIETRVYVSESPSTDPSTTRDGLRRTKMGEDGVDVVVAKLGSELADSGLKIKKMPDKQKGYDVRVDDVRGEVVRYIEVKSTEGKWGVRGVGLSKAQFEKAWEARDHYWLYVVEYLYEYEALIWPIRDPARLVHDFMYDRGWKEMATDRSKAPGARQR